MSELLTSQATHMHAITSTQISGPFRILNQLDIKVRTIIDVLHTGSYRSNNSDLLQSDADKPWPALDMSADILLSGIFSQSTCFSRSHAHQRHMLQYAPWESRCFIPWTGMPGNLEISSLDTSPDGVAVDKSLAAR